MNRSMPLPLPLEGARKQLIAQLVFFDERKHDLLEAFFPAGGKPLELAEKVLEVYVSVVEELLEQFSEDRLHAQALIGSEVRVRETLRGTETSYRIVFPEYADPLWNRTPFLSPLGLQLLLGRQGETYMLELPEGEREVVITAIRYGNYGGIRERESAGWPG